MTISTCSSAAIAWRGLLNRLLHIDDHGGAAPPNGIAFDGDTRWPVPSSAALDASHSPPIA